MADKRAYFKTDVGYFTNPKIAAVLAESPMAVVLHLQSIAYSAQHLRDGKVPARLVQRLVDATDADAKILLDAGLWISHDKGVIEIKDYLEHQRSAADAKDATTKARDAAKSRWGNASSNAPSNASSMPNPMPRERERKKEQTVASAPRADVESLCTLLADLIEANGSKRPSITKGWRDAARLLIDRDGRDADEAARVIRYSQASDFWKPNVLSMPKLRDKYDTLRLQSDRDAAPKTNTPGDQWSRAKLIGGDS